jgi:O-antigen ligase
MTNSMKSEMTKLARLYHAAPILAPAPDRWLMIALAALFFLFPMSKTIYTLPLLGVVVLAFIQGEPSQWWLRMRQTPLLCLPLALYALVVLHAPMSPGDTGAIQEHIRKYARLLLLVLIFLLLVGHERRQRVALNAFAAAMVVTVILTWVNIFLPQPLIGAKNYAVFGDHITQNIMVAFFTLMAFEKAQQSPHRFWRLGWGVVMVLAIVSITHHSIGRTGQVLLFAGWGAYILLILRGRRLVAGFLCLALGAVIAYASSDILRGRAQQAVAEVKHAHANARSSIGHRLYNYKTTSTMIAEKPLLGHGTGAFHKGICRFIDNPADCDFYGWHPHSQFLFFAADHGLVGVALYLAFLVGLFVTALRSRATLSSRVLLFAFSGLLLIDSLINSPLFSSRESQFFAFMGAALLAMNCAAPGKVDEAQSS